MTRLRTMLCWRPEWPFTVIVALAWISLAAGALSPLSGRVPALHAASHLVDSHAHDVSRGASWPDALAEWGVMAAAMMLPVTLPAVRHVAMNSIRTRRYRAMALYVAVFIAVWIGFGVTVLAVARGLQERTAFDGRLLLAAALAAAAAWQLTPIKRRAVFGCRRTVPLPPVGMRADAACARFAWRQAWRCMISCWALMVVMTLAGHALVVMAALTVLMALEELTLFGRRLFGPSAAMLGLAAAIVALTV
jgi:predicted metal-binding membrane protein